MAQNIVRVFQPSIKKQDAVSAGYREAVGSNYQEFFHDIIECLIAALEAKDAHTSVNHAGFIELPKSDCTIMKDGMGKGIRSVCKGAIFP